MVSIVLPAYNQAEFLGCAIESVLKQTYSNWELIIVNDGSTDETDRVAKSHSDSRIRYFSQPHLGLPATLNCGWQTAQGEFLTWTSADNVLLSHMLEELVLFLQGQPSYGAVYSDYVQVDQAGRTIRHMSKGSYRLDKLMNFGPSFLFRRRITQAVGLYDTHLEGIEDRDYSIRMAMVAPVGWLPKVLYQYRVHDNSMTGRYRKGDRSGQEAMQRFRNKWAFFRDRHWLPMAHPKAMHDPTSQKRYASMRTIIRSIWARQKFGSKRPLVSR